MSDEALSPLESEFLAALRMGSTAKAFAAEHGYSAGWAKWKLSRIRAKLGGITTQEAIAMSEVTRGDLDGLRRDFMGALERLEKAVTPAETATAQANVKETGADLTTELRLRGLTLKDLDAAAERKTQEKIDAAVDARMKAREDEAAATAAAAGNGDGDEGDGDEGKKKDGLGGIRNLIR